METEQMSDVYRRIKKRRARERKRRRRRMMQIKFAVSVLVIGLLIVLLVTAFFGKFKQETIYGAGMNVPVTKDYQVNGVAKESGFEKLSAEAVAALIKSEEKVHYPKVSTKYATVAAADVNAPYQAVYCVDERTLVAGRQSIERIYPASMTKVMTLIIAVENLQNLDQTFEMTAEIIDPLVRAEASRAGFDPGEVVVAKDLLYGLALPSGADAAEALALLTFGSSEAFVNAMNEKCSELGLKNTHFVNTSGLHDTNQYSTPLEIAIIMEYAMQNSTCAEVLSTYQYTTQSTPQHPEGILLVSTMFSRMYGNEVDNVMIIAGKTGYTDEAGNCLVSYAKKDDRHYIAVTAGAENRWHVVYDAFTLYENYAVWKE